MFFWYLPTFHLLRAIFETDYSEISHFIYNQLYLALTCILFAGYRVEDFLFEKIDKKRPNRLSNLEYLGQDMIEAGNEFGPGTAYGNF